MSAVIRWIIISILMLVAGPAFSDTSGQAVQIFMCEMEDEANDEDIIAMSGKWLKAAKGMKGGANIQVYLRFPIAAEMGSHDFKFVIGFPSFEEWGAFTDAYEGSPAELVDDEFDKIAHCMDSMLWEGILIK